MKNRQRREYKTAGNRVSKRKSEEDNGGGGGGANKPPPPAVSLACTNCGFIVVRGQKVVCSPEWQGVCLPEFGEPFVCREAANRSAVGRQDAFGRVTSLMFAEGDKPHSCDRAADSLSATRRCLQSGVVCKAAMSAKRRCLQSGGLLTFGAIICRLIAGG